LSPQQVTALELTSARKRPRPATKNGLRSSKKLSYADRLSTDGSDSTWPKSGLIVASSVTLGAMRYLMSPPAARFCFCAKALLVIVDALLVTTYGIASSLRGFSRSSIPCSDPNCDTKPGFDCRSSGQMYRSLYL